MLENCGVLRSLSLFQQGELMRLRTSLFAAALTIGMSSAILFAQKTTQISKGQAGSPHVKSEWTIDGAHISITYGRPFCPL